MATETSKNNVDMVNKEKWFNENARCRLCPKILCCTDHRIAHEKILHPKELRNVLSDISNQGLNTTVRSIKVRQAKKENHDYERDNLKSLKAVKITHSPDCTRKRKRETVPSSPMLQLNKKTKRSLPPHLRTESPRSPLALVNNGVLNDSTVFITANNTVMTSSPYTSPPEFVSKFEYSQLNMSGSGDNSSNRSLESNDSNTSIREFNFSRDFKDTTISNVFNDICPNGNDSFVKINELMNHPNITYDRKTANVLELSIPFEEFELPEAATTLLEKAGSIENFTEKEVAGETQIETVGYMDVDTKEMYIPVQCLSRSVPSSYELSTIHEMSHEMSNNGTVMKQDVNESESNFQPPAQSTFKRVNESNLSAVDLSEVPTTVSATDRDTQEATVAFESPYSDIYAASTIAGSVKESSEINVVVECSNNDIYAASTIAGSIKESSEINAVVESSNNDIYAPSTIAGSDLYGASTIMNSRPSCPTIITIDENDGSLVTQATQIHDSLLSFAEDTIKEDSSDIDSSCLSSKNETKRETSSKDTSFGEKSVVLSGMNVNSKIRINNASETSLIIRCVSSVTEKIVSLLPFNITVSRSCTPSYTVIDLDDYGKDYDPHIERLIRRRDPIREYTTTLEMCRRLIKPIKDRPPYVPSLLLPSIVTLKKKEEMVFNDSLFSEDDL